MHTNTTTVYTDGSCIGNPGPGGWAWAVPGGDWASGADPEATSNRMKLTAVLAALRAIEGPMVVVSDATYVVDSVRRGRYVDWRRNGWKTHTCDTVANQDLGAAERAARHPRRRPRVLLGEGA